MPTADNADRAREIERLAAEIDALRPSYSEAYAALGAALYPELQTTFHAERHADQFAAVAALDERTAALQAQIDELKRQEEEEARARTCPRCGGTVYAEDKFCMGCAMPVSEMDAAKASGDEAVADEPPMTCPGCNGAVTDEMAFCPNCGTKLH